MGVVRHGRDSIGPPLLDWICKEGGRFLCPPVSRRGTGSQDGKCFSISAVSSGPSQPLDKNEIIASDDFPFRMATSEECNAL